MLSRCFLDCSVGVGVFVTGLSQISSLFSFERHRIGLIFIVVYFHSKYNSKNIFYDRNIGLSFEINMTQLIIKRRSQEKFDTAKRAQAKSKKKHQMFLLNL